MKWLVRILVILVVLVALFIASSHWWLDGAAKSVIETAGSDATGVAVTLGSIDIGVLSGSATLGDLNIANPPGCEKPLFFDLKDGRTEVNIRTVMEDTIEIPTVELEGLTMYIEPDGSGKYNYETILANIEKRTGEKSKAEPSAGEEKKEKQIRIKRLSIRDVKVYYKTKAFVTAPAHIDEIVMNDVGSKGDGVDMGELISLVLAGALKGVADELPGAIGDGIKSGVSKLGDIGGVAIDSMGEDVEKGVKKIFGGDD